MIPLFSSDQIRGADEYAINKLGIPGAILMENASISIFNSVYNNFSELISDDAKIGIICGKGNNGGDGFAAARHFLNHGFKITILSLAKQSELKGDAKLNYDILSNLIESRPESEIIEYKSMRDLAKLKNSALIIDAMLGTGAKGNLREPYLSIVNKLNSFAGYKIAIDIPTGINADTGYTENSFEADLTITLAEFKKGLFFGNAKKNCGSIVKGSIGIGSEYFDNLDVDEYLIESEDALEGLPIKHDDLHKYSAGKVLTIAGSENFPGAPVFASNAALISGAGASQLVIPKSLVKSIASSLKGTTIIPGSEESFLAESDFETLRDKLDWADCIVIGPGLGRNESTIKLIRKILRLNKCFVIDADAIFAIGSNFYKQLNLKNAVITPHHKEFADLLGISVADLQMDLLKVGKAFTEITGSYLVLKGAPTLIFNPGGEVFINTSGNPGMAKFGSGDVLSGIIGGFAAQNKEFEPSIISAVYLHSLSADLLIEDKTEFSILAEDIINNFPAAIRFLRDSIL